jgi:hypothetical protein
MLLITNKRIDWFTLINTTILLIDTNDTITVYYSIILVIVIEHVDMVVNLLI